VSTLTGSVRNLIRLFRIAWALARHDALFVFAAIPVAREVAALVRWLVRPFVPHKTSGGRPGQRLARALVELGPTFIKVGQALSIRPDVVGEEIADDLTDLQDRLPPFPFAEVRRIVEEELDEPLEALYASFDETPVAAASIAQVHFATLPDGTEAAVKVLRPGVHDRIHGDLELFWWLAHIAEMTRPQLRRLRPVDTVRTFQDSVEIEMDLRFEAAAAAEMGENFAGDPTFRVPAVDWERTGRRVMTQERVNGIPLDERERIAALGLDPTQIVANAAGVFFNMVFRDGFFHADMHPGNLFVDETGMLVAVDFGIMGRVDKEIQHYLAEMLIGFLSQDYRRVARIHFAAGLVPADKSMEAFTQAVRSMAEPIFGKPMNEISIARLLGHLFQITEQFDMETQPRLLLLQKSMLLTEGVGRSLAPNVNMWELAYPLIEAWVARTMAPHVKAMEAAREVRDAIERLPEIVRHADRISTMLATGGMRLHPETLRQLDRRGNDRVRALMPGWIPWALVGVLVLVLLTRG